MVAHVELAAGKTLMDDDVPGRLSVRHRRGDGRFLGKAVLLRKSERIYAAEIAIRCIAKDGFAEQFKVLNLPVSTTTARFDRGTSTTWL